MVENGRTDFGWAEVSALWATEGKILFDKPHTKLRSVAGGAQTAFAQAWMSKAWADKYGIKTFADIAAKKPPMRIFTKKAGTMGQAGAPLQLEAYGITYADVEAWGGRVVESGLTEIVDALRDDMGDVWLDMHPIGHATAMELTQTTDTLVLRHTEEGLDYLTRYGFAKGLVPAKSWRNQDEDIYQPMASTILIASSDVSDDFVYLVTKAICENADTVRSSFAGAKGFDEKLAGTPERAIIPLHPGAERYYREVGFIK
jgi:TRAP transporter TAXI family solute receptor